METDHPAGFGTEDCTLVSACDEMPLWSAPFGLKLLDLVAYRRGIDALDIGFGTGFPLLELAMRLGPSSTVYGIDPWAAAHDRAMEKAAQYRLGNVRLLQGVAESIPLQDSSIDLIVSNNGINNVDDKSKVIVECRRLLRQGGQFVMTMNLDATMVEFYDVMKACLRDRGLSGCLCAVDDHIRHKRPPLDEIETLLTSHGLKIERTLHDSFTYRFADGTALLSHYFIRFGFLGHWKNCVPQECRTEVFADIEMRINRIAQSDMGFALTVPFVAIDARRQ